MYTHPLYRAFHGARDPTAFCSPLWQEEECAKYLQYFIGILPLLCSHLPATRNISPSQIAVIIPSADPNLYLAAVYIGCRLVRSAAAYPRHY